MRVQSMSFVLNFKNHPCMPHKSNNHKVMRGHHAILQNLNLNFRFFPEQLIKCTCAKNWAKNWKTGVWGRKLCFHVFRLIFRFSRHNLELEAENYGKGLHKTPLTQSSRSLILEIGRRHVKTCVSVSSLLRKPTATSFRSQSVSAPVIQREYDDNCGIFQ